MARRMDWDKARRTKKVPPEPRSSGTGWWWTVPKYGTRCDGCGERIAKDQPYAYNHSQRANRCQVCVDSEGVVAAKSKRYMAWERGLS